MSLRQHNRGDAAAAPAAAAIIHSEVVRKIRCAALRRRLDFLCARSPAGFSYGKASTDSSVRPGPNLPEERNKGRRRAELDSLLRDLRDLISVAGADVAMKARREKLLRHLESADKAHPLELPKYKPGASSTVFFGDGHKQ